MFLMPKVVGLGLTAIFNAIRGVVFSIFYFKSGMTIRLKAIRFGLATKPNDVEFGIVVRLILNK